MKSLLEGLPPEIAKRIHPDWQRNEADYWAQRDTLLSQYYDFPPLGLLFALLLRSLMSVVGVAPTRTSVDAALASGNY